MVPIMVRCASVKMKMVSATLHEWCRAGGGV